MQPSRPRRLHAEKISVGYSPAPSTQKMQRTSTTPCLSARWTTVFGKLVYTLPTYRIMSARVRLSTRRPMPELPVSIWLTAPYRCCLSVSVTLSVHCALKRRNFAIALSSRWTTRPTSRTGTWHIPSSRAIVAMPTRKFSRYWKTTA